MGAKYERRLAGIYSGDEEKIEMETKTVTDEVKKIYLKTIDKPFAVMRGAGSLGIDLGITRFDYTFYIEEKSKKSRNGNNEFYFNGRDKEQLYDLMDLADKCGLDLYYARRLKHVRGEKWRMYDIPKHLSKTNRGSWKLSIDGGIWLSEWLDDFYKYYETNKRG